MGRICEFERADGPGAVENSPQLELVRGKRNGFCVLLSNISIRKPLFID
jgi:hypothetical protein